MQRFIVQLSVIAGLVVLMVIGAHPGAGAQEASPAACPATTEEENVALITRFYADVDADKDVASYFAAEHTAHQSTGVDFANDGPTWFAAREASFPNLTVTPVLVIGDGDLVAALIRWSGTQEGADDYIGIPATGHEADWMATSFFRIECGKIVELWPVSNNLDLLQDLGLITEEEMQSGESMATPTS